MSLNKIPDAKEVVEIRKSKWLETKPLLETLWVMDTALGKVMVRSIKKLEDSEHNSVDIQLSGDSKKSVEDIGKKEWRCEYIKDQNPLLDSIISYLEKKWYKVIFFNRNFTAGDYSWDTRTALWTYMSISA